MAFPLLLRRLVGCRRTPRSYEQVREQEGPRRTTQRSMSSVNGISPWPHFSICTTRMTRKHNGQTRQLISLLPLSPAVSEITVPNWPKGKHGGMMMLSELPVWSISGPWSQSNPFNNASCFALQAHRLAIQVLIRAFSSLASIEELHLWVKLHFWQIWFRYKSNPKKKTCFLNASTAFCKNVSLWNWTKSNPTLLPFAAASARQTEI